MFVQRKKRNESSTRRYIVLSSLYIVFLVNCVIVCVCFFKQNLWEKMIILNM